MIRKGTHPGHCLRQLMNQTIGGLPQQNPLGNRIVIRMKGIGKAQRDSSQPKGCLRNFGKVKLSLTHESFLVRPSSAILRPLVTSWSSEYGLAGRPIQDLKLTEIIRKGYRKHHLRALPHGHFTSLVVAGKINEAVFCSALLSSIREKKWDLDELTTNFFNLIQSFVRKGDNQVLKSTNPP